jgi:hypothetical protein
MAVFEPYLPTSAGRGSKFRVSFKVEGIPKKIQISAAQALPPAE